MKLATTFLLVASAATSVFGSALPLDDGENALVARSPLVAGEAIAAIAAEASIAQIRPDLVQCRTTDNSTDTYAKIDHYIWEGIPYLADPKKKRMCELRKGQTGCGRISCSWNSGIYLCAHNVTENVPFLCKDAANFANFIIADCEVDGRVKGAAWDRKRGFTVEMRNDKC
ncbi:hypothetical protein B0H63DRAFT_31567 [Podospora didyma]|uniref:Uncharacterized protein n=1 Tax=Podospora didyma TaxID=330526 RepID=A0AAE0P652_9PEZI|nr:hypothetical protein B0H63DRAFT_31567 [Podospora didyma]